MDAGRMDLKCNQGADFEELLVLFTGDPLEPWDLTGCTLRAQVRKYTGSPDLIAEITCTITDAAAGEVMLSLTAAQTAAIDAPGNSWKDAKVYAWDLLLTTPSGKLIRLLNGSFAVSPRGTV